MFSSVSRFFTVFFLIYNTSETTNTRATLDERWFANVKLKMLKLTIVLAILGSEWLFGIIARNRANNTLSVTWYTV